MNEAIADHLLAEAGEDLIDRMMEGEAVEWLDEAGAPIDLAAKPRAVTNLAVTVPLYYD